MNSSIQDPWKIADAHGLIWRPSKNGRTATWQCRSDIARKKFKPVSEKIIECREPPTEAERDLIKGRCKFNQQNMLTFANGGPPAQPTGAGNGFDGTIKSLVILYEASRAYKDRRHSTRRNYAARNKQLVDDHGSYRAADIKPSVLDAWRETWLVEVRTGERASRPGVTGDALVGHLLAMVNILLGFGASYLEDDGCAVALLKLKKMPKQKIATVEDDTKIGNDENIMTPAQSDAIRRKAHEMGHPVVALAQAIQFQTGFRQKDIIGEWVPKTDPGVSDIVRGEQKWMRGLRWNKFREDAEKLILDVTTSKTGERWVGNVRLSHAITAELSRLPQPLPGAGPVIVNPATGLPFEESSFRKLWRRIKLAAGVPDNVKNRHNRHGAITAAINANVATKKVQAFSTHGSENVLHKHYWKGSNAAIDEVLAALNKTETK